jgi:hypothetical protein
MAWERGDVLKALYDSADLVLAGPGQGLIWTDFAPDYLTLHRFTEALRKASELEIDQLQRSLAKGNVDRRYQSFGETARDPIHAHIKFSEQTETFLRCIDRSCVPAYRWLPHEPVRGGKTAAQAFAEFVADLRYESRRKETTRAIARRREHATRNAASAVEVIKRLTDKPEGLHVSRITLAYNPTAPFSNAHQLVAHLTALLNRSRHRDSLRSMKGYLWKLEFGLTHGFRIHLVLFMAAASISSDPVLVVAELWSSVTNRMGVAWSASFQERLINPAGLYSGGTGLWSGKVKRKRADLVHGVQFLILKDEFLRPRDQTVCVFNHTELVRTLRLSKKSSNGQVASVPFPHVMVRRPLPSRRQK